MATTKWIIDPAHSEIQFKVKHLMITTVTGQFNVFKGDARTEEQDFSTAKIRFSAEIDSISTNNAQRDAHLKNSDFFDSANYPNLIFESTRMEKVNKENYKLHGQLTMRGNTKPVVLDVVYGGLVRDPWGNTRAGFTVTGTINRQDFGISFGAVTETGGLLLADEVRIAASTQFIKEAVAEQVLAN